MSSHSHALPHTSRIVRCALLALCTLVLILGSTSPASGHAAPASQLPTLPLSALKSGQSASALLRADARGNGLSCADGDYYTLSRGGNAYRTTSQDGSPSGEMLQGLSFPSAGRYTDFNGLAIGDGGRVAYAYDREFQDGRGVAIYRWSADSGYQRVYGDKLPRDVTISHIQLVTGGMDPTSATSPYYFGGFYKNGSRVYFELLRLNGSQVTKVGYIEVARPDDNTHADNGDIAFDSAGDLFILWSNGYGETKLVPVDKKSIDEARGGEIFPSGNIPELETNKDRYNGLAFDRAGNLFLQYSERNGAYTANYSIDPDDGQKNIGEKDIVLPDGRSGTDLASCANPSTLFLAKDLRQRVNPGDQFRIAVAGKEGKVLASDETAGSETGLTAAVGIFVTKKNRVYTLSEEAIGGADLNDYTSTLTCIDGYTGQSIETQKIGGDRSAYTLKIDPDDSRDYYCTFTNTPKPETGSLAWDKTASTAPSQLLPGSEWSLTGPGGATLAVKDCASAGQ